MANPHEDFLLGDEVMHDHDSADISDIATTYLKLDASNDPLTGQLNTQIVVPNISATYNLGDSTHYWLNTYTGSLYLNSTAYISGATAGRHTFTGNIWLNNAGSTITFNEATDVVLTGASGQLNLTGNLDVSGHAAIGYSGNITNGASLQIYGSDAINATDSSGIDVRQTNSLGGSVIGIGGYSIVTSNTVTYAFGLNFGPYSQPATINNRGTSTGINTWGHMEATFSVSTVDRTIALAMIPCTYFQAWEPAYLGGFNCKLSTGLFISDVHQSGGTVNNIIGIQISNLATASTMARQIELGGYGSKTGIFFGGETGIAWGGGSNYILIEQRSASYADDYYNGKQIKIISGTGAGQIRTISDYQVYDGTNMGESGTNYKVTVSANWTTNPNETSVYTILNHTRIYNSAEKVLDFAVDVGGTETTIQQQKITGTYLKKGIYTENILTKTSAYTTTTSDVVIVLNKSTDDTLTLHAATGSGQHLYIRNKGEGDWTIDANDSETINEELTQIIHQGDSVHLIDEASGSWGIY